jgi:hypothetical protein
MQAIPRLCILMVALALPARTASAATEISRFVIGAGGGSSTSMSHASCGTVGQPTVAEASSPGHSVEAGFWSGLGVVVGIDEPELPNVPLAYRLYQNRPNPALSRTTIRFDVPEDGVEIGLRIYDLRGAVVRTLVEGPQSAGEKRVDWNGLDDRGERAAAGVYLYVLETPEARFIRKLTMLR